MPAPPSSAAAAHRSSTPAPRFSSPLLSFSFICSSSSHAPPSAASVRGRSSYASACPIVSLIRL
ncbi:hypothetical protein Hanom_Chr06g00558611 [Helianthus anomalus]